MSKQDYEYRKAREAEKKQSRAIQPPIAATHRVKTISSKLVKFVGMIGDNEVTTMFIARVIGIPVGPLGAVLGYF